MKIFCDLDGTLINVAPRHYRVYSEMIFDFNGTPMAFEEYWSLKRDKVKWPSLLKSSGVDPSVEAEFLAGFIQKIEDSTYLDEDTLFPGVEAMLARLGAEHELYLVSLRRNHDNLARQITKLGLEQHFLRILSGHSETDGFDKKIELIGGIVGDGKGAIIGDTEADIITGKSLNLLSIGVKSGIRGEKFLADLKPDYLLDSFADVATVSEFF